MAVQGEVIRVAIAAGADLSAMQYRAVEIDGTLAVESDTVLGILQNKPKNGEDASVSILGKMKGIAGAAVAAGARVKVASGGFLVTVASGDGVACGKNLDAAVASGDTFSLVANFVNASTLYDQQ